MPLLTERRAPARAGGPAAPVYGDDGKLYGSAVPRIWTPPLRELTPRTSLGYEVIAFAREILGIELLEFQKWWLIHALEILSNDECDRRGVPHGSYRFRQLFLLVSRQNGKTTLAKVLILWKMYVDGAKLVMGAAQTLGDAEDTWEAVLTEAEDNDLLRKRLAVPKMSSGKRRMTVKRSPAYSGSKYIVVPLVKKAARGKTVDFLFLDELREHTSWVAWEAMEPTTAVPPRAQIMCASNAGDATSVVLRETREAVLADLQAGTSADSPIFWAEYSAPDGCDLDDEIAIAQANPAYRYTLPASYIVSARKKPEPSYRTENLCQEVRTLKPGAFPLPAWRALTNREAARAAGTPVFVGVDVNWKRSHSAVSVAFRLPDGRIHVEVIAHRYGTAWVAPWLKGRMGATKNPWFTGRVALQSKGAPVASLIEEFEAHGIDVIEWQGQDLGQSFGKLYDAILRGEVSHMGQPVLDMAVEHVQVKHLGDASFLDRKHDAVDVSPIVAAQAAYWYATKPVAQARKSIYEDDAADAKFVTAQEKSIQETPV